MYNVHIYNIYIYAHRGTIGMSLKSDEAVLGCDTP